MISKINILNIVIAHFRTFKNIRKRKTDWCGIVLMFVVPAIIASLLYDKTSHILYCHISDFLTFVSIIGGFLFNLLAIIHSVLEKVNSQKTNFIKQYYAKEIHANIAFGILVAIATSFSLVLTFFDCPNFLMFLSEMNVLGWILYFLLIVFLLNLLLILKKIFIVLENPS